MIDWGTLHRRKKEKGQRMVMVHYDVVVLIRVLKDKQQAVLCHCNDEYPRNQLQKDLWRATPGDHREHYFLGTIVSSRLTDDLG